MSWEAIFLIYLSNRIIPKIAMPTRSGKENQKKPGVLREISQGSIYCYTLLS